MVVGRWIPMGMMGWLTGCAALDPVIGSDVGGSALDASVRDAPDASVRDAPDASAATDVPSAIDTTASTDATERVDLCPMDAGEDARPAMIADVPSSLGFLDEQAWPGPANPSTLRPRWPRTNAHVGSRRPILRWVRPASVTTVTVVACRDRAMTRDCISFASEGSEGRPPADLAPGRWFWQPRADEVRGATWAIRIPTATIHDRAWGGDLDFNGDGLADVPPVVSRGRVVMWLSAPDAPGGTPLELGSLSPTDYQTADVGDVNGDGYSDVVVMPTKTHRELVRASVFRGSPSGGLPPLPVRIDSWPLASGWTFRVGDLDDDGVDDLGLQNNTRQYLFRGGPDGLRGMMEVVGRGPYLSVDDVTGDGIPDYTVRQPSGQVGVRLQPDVAAGTPGRLVLDPDPDDRASELRLGDVDGDGVAEVSRDGDAQEVELGGPVSGRTFTLNRPPMPFRVSPFSPIAGDFDGDGLDDILFEDWGNGLWYRRLDSTGVAPIPQLEGFGTAAWHLVQGGGDFDGDGTTDLFRTGSTETGRWLALSDSDGPSINQRGVRYAALDMWPPRYFGEVVAAVVGDLDGDGAAEVVYRSSSLDGTSCLSIMYGRTGRFTEVWCGTGLESGRGFSAGNVTGSGAHEALLNLGFEYRLFGAGRTSGQRISSPHADATALFPAGDVNGDGVADLAAVGRNAGYVLFGVRGALPREGGRFVLRTAGALSDLAVLPAGDLNADGFGDFVLLDLSPVVFAGSASGVRAEPLLTNPAYLGATPVGDLDGDGGTDLIVRTATDLRFLRGGRDGLREVEAARHVATVRKVIAVGDVNGDRRADFCADSSLVFGSAAGPDYEHALAWPDREDPCLPTNDPRGGGDWDGDGISDVVTFDGFRSVASPRRRTLPLRLP